MNLLNTKLRRSTAVVAGMFLGLVGVVAFAAPASAHEPELKGTPSCVQNGEWKVDWAVANPWKTRATIKTVKLNGESVTAVGNIHVGATVAPNWSQWLSGTTNTNLEALSLEVTLSWPDWTGSRKRIVHRPHGCTRPTTHPTPPTSPSSPTASQSSSSVPPTRTTPTQTASTQTPPTEPTPTQPTPTQPSPSPSLPIPSVPAEPTPILTMDCTSMTIGLDNPAKGVEFKLHIEPSTGSDKDLVVKPGEKKTAKFAATTGFKLTVTISATYDGKSYSDTDTVDYVRPDDCASGALPTTGSSAGPLAGGAAAALAIGGLLFYLARRRKVKFTA